MEDSRHSLELKVGLFTLFGLLLTAALAIYFGRATEPFKEKYPLIVHFDNASGLLKGSQVLMGGARIGQVMETPEISRQQLGVIVSLQIYEYVQIPADSAFKVRSSGLLGDSYIDVQPKKGLAEATAFLEPGAVVKGDSSGGGIEALASSGTELVEDLKGTNAELNRLLTRLNDEVFSEDFVEDIHGTAENARSATANLDEDLAGITEQLNDTMANLKKFSGQLETIGENAQDTTANLKSSSARLDGTLNKVDDAVSGLDEAVENLNSLITDAGSGDGVLAGLLSDENLRNDVNQTIGNLRGLSANLKRHGILWYRNTAPDFVPNQSDQNTSAPPGTITPESTDTEAFSRPRRAPGSLRR